MALNSLNTYATRQTKNLQRNDVTGISSIFKGKIESEDIYFTTTNANHNYTLFRDIPTSRNIKDITVEVQTTLAGNEGFTLFSFPYSDASSIYTLAPGLVVFLNSSGFPVILEGVGKDLSSTQTPLNSTNYAATNHKYRVSVTVAGLATLFIDNVQIGTCTMTNTAHAGGFFGLWKYGTGIQSIDKVITR